MIVYTIVRNNGETTDPSIDVLDFCWTEEEKAKATIALIKDALARHKRWCRAYWDASKGYEAANAKPRDWLDVAETKGLRGQGFEKMCQDLDVAAALSAHEAYRIAASDFAKGVAEAASPGGEKAQITIAGEDIDVWDTEYSVHEMVVL